MRRYYQTNNNHAEDNSSPNKGIIVTIGVAIIGVIMAAAAVIFADYPLIIGGIAIGLCIVLIIFCRFVLTKEYDVKKWIRIMSIALLVLVCVLFVVLSKLKILDIFNKETDDSAAVESSTIVEPSPASDIPIIVDMSFHSTHEKKDINGNES